METGDVSRQAEIAVNLRRGGVKPLRNAARPAEIRQTLSVEALRNGGDLNLGQALEGSGETRTLRQQAGAGSSRASARQSRSSGLSLPERIQKLAQIKKSATEYEAIFVNHLVKLMRPSPLAKMPGGETFSEMAEQPFRDHLTRAGGLGLANSIIGQVVRQEGLEQTLQEHPEVMGPTWRPTIPKNLGPKYYGGLTRVPAGLEPQSEERVSAPEIPKGPERAGEAAEIAGPRRPLDGKSEPAEGEDEHGYPEDT